MDQFLRVAENAIGMGVQALESGPSVGRSDDEPLAFALYLNGNIGAEHLVEKFVNVFAELRSSDSSGHDQPPWLRCFYTPIYVRIL
jgi:hypothetical protein